MSGDGIREERLHVRDFGLIDLGEDWRVSEARCPSKQKEH